MGRDPHQGARGARSCCERGCPRASGSYTGRVLSVNVSDFGTDPSAARPVPGRTYRNEWDGRSERVWTRGVVSGSFATMLARTAGLSFAQRRTASQFRAPRPCVHLSRFAPTRARFINVEMLTARSNTQHFVVERRRVLTTVSWCDARAQSMWTCVDVKRFVSLRASCVAIKHN